MQIICHHIAAFYPIPRVTERGGGLGQNIYYHVAAFLISFKGACRQTICHHVAAFDPLQGLEGGGGPGNIFTTMLVHS